MIERVAYLSFHTSPLSQPGTGNAGGMNVYVDELARTMAERGVEVDVFTRREDAEAPEVVEVAPGYRVVHLEAGPMNPLSIVELSDHVFGFAERVVEWSRRHNLRYDLVHSHYWLSGWAGLMIKRLLGIPLANSFHTLGRVKDATRRADQPPTGLMRIAAELDVIAGSDCVVAATPIEMEDLLEHYGADPARLCLNPPGINHDWFSPGDQEAARRRIGVDPTRRHVLFVGRIQAIKGLDVTLDAFEHVVGDVADADLLIVGGASGSKGPAELRALRDRISGTRLSDRVELRTPQPHRDLADYYRAADVLVLPSRSESFGLVAVEAQACGVPVVAAAIGGLNHVVVDGMSGFLVDGWEPADYAKRITAILCDRNLAESLSTGAIAHAGAFSWDLTASRLLELYDGITS